MLSWKQQSQPDLFSYCKIRWALVWGLQIAIDHLMLGIPHQKQLYNRLLTSFRCISMFYYILSSTSIMCLSLNHRQTERTERDTKVKWIHSWTCFKLKKKMPWSLFGWVGHEELSKLEWNGSIRWRNKN